MDRLERLINLVAALKAADRPLTRAELQERVPGYPEENEESARRAFERDKEALRSMGIPISTESIEADHGFVDAYRIRAEDYELPDPGLDADELAALHLAISAVHLEGGDGTAALWKLGGGRPGDGAEIAMGGGEHLTLLFGAVGARQAVRFRYRDQARTVDPWRIAYRNGRWYLSGRDHDRDEERQFRLDRLSDAALTGPAGAFERPPRRSGSPPDPWEMGEEEPIAARLLVDGDHVDWAVQFLGADRLVQRADDGSGVFALVVRNREAFRSLVLSFLDHAEVLEPEELRAEVVAWLEELT